MATSVTPPPPPPKRTCTGNGPCPQAIWTRRAWGELVCEVCHPTPIPKAKP